MKQLQYHANIGMAPDDALAGLAAKSAQDGSLFMEAQAGPGPGARARRGSSDAAGLSGRQGLRAHFGGRWNWGPGSPAACADRRRQVRFRAAMKR